MNDDNPKHDDDIASPEEQVEKEREVPTMAGDPEHANPQPMMSSAPRRKADREMKPADAEAAPSNGEAEHGEHEAEGEHQEHEAVQEATGEENEQPREEPHEEAVAQESVPDAVPGTPASTDTHLASKPVEAAKAPTPGTIVASKTASSNPVEGVPMLDSNHTLSHQRPATDV